MDEGCATDKTIADDGTIEVPDDHAAKEACIIAPSGAVLGYEQVQSDGTIQLDPNRAGKDVQVVIPSDEQFERRG